MVDPAAEPLSAYYRENHYSPLSQLKSSISLLLQIPFFLAAYDLLGVRAAERFAGTGGGLFGFDLGAPDGLLSFAGITINALPILMTLVNILACYIYTKGYPFKTALRSYLLAVVFLVLSQKTTGKEPHKCLVYGSLSLLVQISLSFAALPLTGSSVSKASRLILILSVF